MGGEALQQACIYSFRFVSSLFASFPSSPPSLFAYRRYSTLLVYSTSRFTLFSHPRPRTITATAHPGLRTAIFFSWEEEPGTDALAARSPFDPQSNRKARVESNEHRSPGDRASTGIHAAPRPFVPSVPTPSQHRISSPAQKSSQRPRNATKEVPARPGARVQERTNARAMQHAALHSTKAASAPECKSKDPNLVGSTGSKEAIIRRRACSTSG